MAEEKEINVNEAENIASEEKQEKKAEGTAKKEKKTSNKAEIEALKKEIEELKKTNEEQNDKYLRMVAEYENYRKRAQKEREGIYSDAYVDVIKEVLPVLDNLERAVAFKESGNLADGVTMIVNMFKETFEKMGVAEIETDGKEFDPNVHNAVMHVEDESLGENTVVETFSKGYKKGDKVIRYAMVKVAN